MCFLLILRPQTAKTNMAANVQFLYPSASEEMSNVSVHIPQNLNWIWSQKGRQLFHKVLQIVSNPQNETGESSAAQILLSKTFQPNEDRCDDLAILFLKEISMSFHSCFRNVQDIKCVNVKMTKLESSFKTVVCVKKHQLRQTGDYC